MMVAFGDSTKLRIHGSYAQQHQRKESLEHTVSDETIGLPSGCLCME